MDYCQILKVKPLQKPHVQKQNCLNTETLFYTMGEYFLQPTIFTALNKTKKTKILNIGTPVIESIYLMLYFLQLKEQLFVDSTDTGVLKSDSANTTILNFVQKKKRFDKDESVNLLLSMQPMLLDFFKCAFSLESRMSSHGYIQGKHSDIGLLWLKLIQPWNFDNSFIRTAASVDQTIFQGRQPIYETFPKAGGLASFGKAILECSISGYDGRFYRDEANYDLAAMLSTSSLIDHYQPRNIFQLTDQQVGYPAGDDKDTGIKQQAQADIK